MKTFVPFTKAFIKLLIFMVLFASAMTLHAQNIEGLVFKDPVRESGDDLKKGTVYLFKNVTTGVNATVTITDLVNGASVKKIDDNSGGLGYEDAFQPEVQIGSKGESYASFTIRFIDAVTGLPKTLKSVQATSLDIDGNGTLKEFADINMNGGSAIYKGGTLEILLKNIPVIGQLFNEFRADNILGLEKDGIDTTAKGNMYTVTNSDVSVFTVKYGAKSTNNSNSSRQYSLYMKGFQYPNQILLPLDLLSFNAFLTSNQVNLSWSTASEKNVSHFAVERSYDGKNFSDAATVFAYGNTAAGQKMDYSYTDKSAIINSNIIYYRLRCIDIDGKYTYSQVRIIKAGGQQSAGAKVQTYPNPFVNELRITLPGNWQGKAAAIELFNANGQLVKTQRTTSTSQTETIATTDLERGFYVIRVTSATEKVQYKVVKN